MEHRREKGLINTFNTLSLIHLVKMFLVSLKTGNKNENKG